jgi:SAM-dependent methyltransferase
MPVELRPIEDLVFLERHRCRLPATSRRRTTEYDEGVRFGRDRDEKRAEIGRRDRDVALYDALCGTYADRLEIRTMVRSLSIPPGARILEVGAGTGRLTCELAQMGHEVVALDFSAKSLERLRRKCAGRPGRVHVVQADACRLPARVRRFDAVVSAQLLEHFPSQDGRADAFGGMVRSLRNGGRIVASVYNYGIERRHAGPKEGHHASGIYYYCFDRDDVRALARRYSDSIEIDRLIGMVHYWPKRDRFPGVLRRRIDALLSRSPLSARLAWLLLIVARRVPAPLHGPPSLLPLDPARNALP